MKGGYKLQLCIRADYVTLGDVLIGTTNNALGNFVNVLECEFPSDDYTSEKYILNCLQRKRKAVYGLNENGSVLTSFYLFMNGERRRALTLQATDAFRISNNVKVGLPIALSNKADYSNGMVFNVNSAVAVVYALLFYYGFNNLRIVQCGLCDRWFATPNMREKYCSRNALLAGYEHLHCEQAVRNALQNLQRRKKKVYGKLYENGGETDINGCPIAIDDFLNKCAVYSDAIRQRATAANINAYSDYLDGCLSRVGLRRYKKTGG